ncbi:glycosyltransferase [Hydrogenophaga sp.]|uniref:glycosyltransferase n=1 Tax=Hydrogenophaga sp. TaxID=1904254 RepID=UPI0019C50C35|nr:glycosyltransferase [Hydrogenophaga sp.]MBD3893572.1 glycosyltransferase [Hydrogenophaga sp.]
MSASTHQAAPARVLLHAFSTFKLGGPQARFVELAHALGSSYRHLVLAMDNCFDAGERLGASVDWQPLRLHVTKGGALDNQQQFRAVLKSVRPDLLLSYNWGAIEWAAANFPKLLPQVHVEDGFGPDEAGRQLPRRVLTRHILLGFNRVPVVVASRHLERIACQHWRLRADQVHFLANGVALAPSERETTRPAGAETVVCIGTVAGLRPEKNLARLLRAFAQLRAHQAARLIVVGGGPLLGELQALAQELGVAAEVEFTGYLPDPAQRLAEFDLFALSSDTEQLPLALLEAMAIGLPVVATRVGDVGSMLADVSPENVAAPDDESFARTLIAAVQQRARWPYWSHAGREKVRRSYSRAQMLTEWKAVFDGHLGRGAHD